MTRPLALVTGASRGIGRGIALCLAEAGYDLALGTTKADPANTESGVFEVVAQVEARGGTAFPVEGDVGDLAQHEGMVETILARYPRIDLLVNNAGVAAKVRRDILELEPESFDRLTTINLRGPLFLTQRVARQMIAQQEQQSDAERPPAIVFITSVSAHTASPSRAEYCISKCGLSMASQTFAIRLAPHNINVYEIRPGVIATDMTAVVKDKYDAQIRDGMLLQPRWGTPEDIGKAVTALATGAFPYSTGAIFDVDGGFQVRRL